MHNEPTPREIQLTRWDAFWSLLIGAAGIILFLAAFVDAVSKLPVA